MRADKCAGPDSAALAQRLGIGFWTAMFAGLVLAAIAIGLWLVWAPRGP